jgi:hypothetical protein
MDEKRVTNNSAEQVTIENPPKKKFPKCGKHLHKSENAFLDLLPERSNTVLLPLQPQPLPLQAQD